MSEPIRILIVEDQPTDAELAQREIKQALPTCIFQQVETLEDFLSSLESFEPDLIISDYSMPRFNGLIALKLALAHDPLTPVIIFTGAINEETAVECMKAGATDYVIKEHIKRLGQAVLHALKEKRARQERKQVDQALRESEARFRGTFEQAAVGMGHLALDGRWLRVNQRLCDIVGYTRQEFLALTVQDLTHPDDLETDLAYSQQVLVNEISTYSMEKRYFHKDGSLIWVDLTVSLMRAETGKPLYFIRVIQDISRRKEAEESQANLEQQLRQAQKMESIGRLAGGIAHDFNNLLTVILGYCALIQTRAPTGQVLVNNLEQIQQAGESASNLTRQLLTFSRKQILSPTVLDLNNLVTNLHKMLKRLIGEDIELSIIPQPDLHPVIADSGQMEQVIMNLVVNARDAMPTGGMVTIETNNVYHDDVYMSTHFDAVPGPAVMLAVSDTGQGMDKQTQAQIFEPFFTTKEAGKGTGLGLAMVYGIVKQSRGDIIVYSEPGQGTVFKIYLPVGKVEVLSPPSPQAQPVSQRGNETILLAEDEEIIRNLMRIVLAGEGYTILEAANGEEALALVAQDPTTIALLITDVIMPRMSGPELAKKLKATQPQIKILYTSGYTDDSVVRHGLMRDEIEFLAKPFSPSTLIAKVREVLDQ